MNIYYYKLGIDIKRFFKEIGGMFLPASGVCFIGFSLEHFFVTQENYIFIIKTFLYSTLFICIMHRFALNKYEKNLLQEVINFFIKHIKI
jgi:hypothetical protein